MFIASFIAGLVIVAGGVALTIINFKRTPRNLRPFYGPGYVSLGLLCVLGGVVISTCSLCALL